MCPSFKATRAEEHSPRGRARLLGEMISGDLLTEGWRSSEVREALDLCLGCKACKVECPVGVDIAAYRVDFLARYYRHRLRPRAHYAFGFLPLGLRLGSLAPRLANALLQAPLLSRVVRRAGGISREHCRRWCPARAPPAPSLVVAQFSDCFTTYLDPDVADAADEVPGSRHQPAAASAVALLRLDVVLDGTAGIARGAAPHGAASLRVAGRAGRRARTELRGDAARRGAGAPR